jgi:probable HAF family extracellular repeat protein
MKARWLRNFLIGLIGAVVLGLGLSIFTAITATTSFSYVVTDLGILNGYTSSSPSELNDAAQVVGSALKSKADSRAFLWVNGTMKDLGTLGGSDSYASGINNKGQIVGRAATSSGTYTYHAFLWTNGTMKDLGTLGGSDSYAYGINNKGQVVGSARTSSGAYTAHAFLWTNGTMRDLNSLLPAKSGWELTSALDINNKGQIVGEGKFNGQTRAFLLTPT